MADVFVGFFYDEKKAEQLLAVSKGGISAAANQYQQGFLSGLSGATQILSTLSLGTFPRRCKQLFFNKTQACSPEGNITYLPFVNLHFLKDAMFRRGLYKALHRILSQQPHTTIYVYSLNVVFERVMARLKKKFGNKFSYVLIIPDLPGNYGLVRKGIKGLKDRLDTKPKMSLAAYADSYVFLTEAMKELFPQKPYVVIEGFLPATPFDYTQKRQPKSVLYTGTLNGAFGICDLLDAFRSIPDPEYRLWICGAGGEENAVKEAARQDPRICFKGFLPKDEIARLQTQCDVLINPRKPEGEYTKYSFPSKTMEYLLSGSKVVMYRLPGIGGEYYRYIRTIPGDAPEAIREAIVRACRDTEFYNARWQEQINWIQNSKNAYNQLEKLLEIMECKDYE